jgi:pimeloyl-ACP methyl ester carboxylesterase
MDKQSFTPINIRGAELNYQRSGSGEPLILIHPNISDARSFARIEPLLAKYFDVITLCRRHHWPNEPLADGEDDQWDEHAQDLAVFIEKLQLGSAHVLGNSNSALIALILARNRPELVKSLTLEEPVGIPIFLPRTPPGIFDLLHLLWYFPRLFLPLVLFGARVMPVCDAAFRAGDNEAGLQAFARAVIGEEQMKAMPPERVEQMRANVKPHAAIWTGAGMPKFSEQDLRGIKTPTLFVTGEQTTSTHTWTDYYMAPMVPGAKEARIQGAAHFVHEDKPDEVVAAMLDYLKLS